MLGWKTALLLHQMDQICLQKGLALFYQLLEQRLDLLSEFAGDYYPLTQTSMISGDCDRTKYGWAEGPMPWEGACI